MPQKKKERFSQNHNMVDAIESVASTCYQGIISKDVAIIAEEKEKTLKIEDDQIF